MINVRIRWKESATAKDMTDVVHGCRAAGYRIVAGGPAHGWYVFTRELKGVGDE